MNPLIGKILIDFTGQKFKVTKIDLCPVENTFEIQSENGEKLLITKHELFRDYQPLRRA